MGALELLLERNRRAAKAFVASQTWPKLCIVTCDDAALTGQLEARLGLGAGDAVIVRLPAGGGSLSIEVVQRAVAKAALVDGCDEVLVLSHSSCALYDMAASTLSDAVTKAGIPRAAIPMDLRELIGAGRDPRETVRMTADALRRCAYLPPSLLVHLGHLDESTGALVVVENGEQFRIDRASAGATSVAGYTSGPTKLEALPAAAALPLLEGFHVEALSAPAMPEVRAFEATPISVSLPQVTTQLAGTVQLPEITTELIATASMAGPEHTAQSMLGRAASTAAQPATLTQEGLFGTVQAMDAAPTHKKRAAGDKRPMHTKPNQVAKAPPLRPQLVSAIEKLRAFMGNEVAKPDRRAAIENLNVALQEGGTAEDLVKIVLKPVLQSGQARYKVIDEMILVKDEVTRMGPVQAATILKMLVP